MDLTEQALRLFPGSQIISHDSYEAARDRMLTWVRSLKDVMPSQVGRWALACEGATDALGGPYAPMAERCLQEDLTVMLSKLHEKGLALEYASPDPATWPARPQFCISENMADPAPWLAEVREILRLEINSKEETPQ